MITVPQQQLVGALKATGSSDPDVLFAAKEATMKVQRQLKLVATGFMLFGAVLTITLLGAPVGLPLLIGAYWLRRKVARNLADADATYGSYVAHARSAASTADSRLVGQVTTESPHRVEIGPLP
ncbi:MAG TPA: hypothetical protein VKZ41_09750 [Gemmatimonadales bacterium]|nr:hypothetical protein [Gemmatimonadales bacterium]